MLKDAHSEVKRLLCTQLVVLVCVSFLAIFLVELRAIGAFVVGGLSYIIPQAITARWYFRYRGAFQTHRMLRALLGGQLLKWVSVIAAMWFCMRSSVVAALLGLFTVGISHWFVPLVGYFRGRMVT